MKNLFCVIDFDSNEEISTHHSYEDARAAVVALIAKSAEDVAYYIVERFSNY